MNPLCVSAIAPTVLPIAIRPTTMIATISSPVLLRIAFSFLIDTHSSSYQVFHLTLVGTSYTVHIPADDPAASLTLRDRDLLQSSSRLLVLSRVDLALGVALLQCLQCLVVSRAHLARKKTAHDPDHQQNNGYPEEHHHPHSYEPPTSQAVHHIHHVRILLLKHHPHADHAVLSLSLRGRVAFI